VLLKYKDLYPDNKYKLDIIFRDNRILSLKISQTTNGIKRLLIIKDSFPLLDSSLEKLGKDFHVEVLKGVFPYTFSTHDNLFYEGKTPFLSFYGDLSVEKYAELVTDN